VGSWGETYGRFRPLVYRFDGSNWTSMPAPFNGDPGMPLHSVAVLGPNDVWVTADRITVGSGPVTAHWNGSSWTEHANPGGTGAVIGVGANEVYGFGSTVTRWDGVSWTVVNDLAGVPSPALHAAAVTPGGEAWAVGRQIPGDDLQTLAVRGQGLGEVATAGEPPPAGRGPGLSAPWPNPARSTATIAVSLAAPADVDLRVYDSLGREMASLDAGVLAAGTTTIPIDVSALPAGTFLIRAASDGSANAVPLTIVR
jgi:hypothetical protein